MIIIKVYGHSIPQPAIDAAVERMKEAKEFTIWNVKVWLCESSEYVNRSAGYLIDKQKRSGNIEYDRKKGGMEVDR